MSISRLMQMGAAGQVSGEVEAQAIDFDGTNDYLSRSTDLVGNTDSKTFTFSAWVYLTSSSTGQRIIWLQDTSSNRFWVDTASGPKIRVFGYNSSGTNILSAELDYEIPLYTWVNILISIDMSNTSRRHVFADNVDITSTASWFQTNDAIDFTTTDFGVGARPDDTGHLSGRLSNVFLDYTYRDLSVEANRRLFVTADLKLADGQAALNPILYLPMDDPTQPGRNDGTGGDFTLNGVVARSDRGPNQYNCAASFFDGVSDYLYKHSNITATNPSQITMSLTYMVALNSGDRQLFIISDTDDLQSRVNVRINTADQVSIFFQPEDRSKFITLQANVSADDFVHNHVVISVDCTDSSLKSAFFNGEDISSSIIYSDTFSSIGLVQSGPRLTLGAWNRGGGQADGTFYRGDIGEFYLDTTYRDLSVDNPFWDSETNRPKPVRQVIEETGSTPLMALPMNGVNPGTNLGTGGDFTVNSGPLEGARGLSEFWARSASFNSTTDNLTASVNTIDASTISACFAFKIYSGSASLLNFVRSGSNYWGFTVGGGGSTLEFFVSNSINQELRFRVVGFNPFSNDWHTVLLKFSTSTNASDSKVYINGTEYSLSKVSDEGSGYKFDLSGNNITFFGSSSFRHDLGAFYLHRGSIDFSLEANRNLFIDAFGYLKNLTPGIGRGDIPTPLIYTKFEDPDNLGANSGSGNDFTVNGSVQRGADVDISTN